MRTREEIEQAYKAVGTFLDNPDYEDDETLQAIYDTIKWFDGYDWESTIESYLPLP